MRIESVTEFRVVPSLGRRNARTSAASVEYYCLSQTNTTFLGLPFASTPFDVRVMIFPSLEIKLLAVATTLPAFLLIAVVVFASMRLTAMVSCPFGPTPETGNPCRHSWSRS